MGAASAEAMAAKLRGVRRYRQLLVDWAEKSGNVKLKVSVQADAVVKLANIQLFPCVAARSCSLEHASMMSRTSNEPRHSTF